MGAWQKSIVNRLAELRSDTQAILDRLAHLEERVAHLPGKGFIVSVVFLALGAFAALSAFQEGIRNTVGSG